MGGGRGFNCLWFNLFIVVFLFATIVHCDHEVCTYKFKVKTGTKLNAGTDSVIGVTLYNSTGWGVKIADLAKWGGTKGPNYNYFEWGKVDEFKGTGPCVGGQLCKIKITSDGSGLFDPGWFCEYVEVEAANGKTKFTVQEWLDKSNGLTYVKDECGKYARESLLIESVVPVM